MSSRLARRLDLVLAEHRRGDLAREDAIRECVRLGLAPSEAEIILRSAASPAIIPALATTTLS